MDQSNAAQSAQTPDFGQRADDRPHGFSQPWMDEFNKAPYCLPGDLVVAGDESPHGQRLSGTFLDDGRAKLPWSPEHEGLLQAMLSAPVRVRLHGFKTDAQGQRVPVMDSSSGKQAVNGAGFAQWERETREIATFPGLSVNVYLMGHGGNKRHAADWYPVVEDGRQRRDAAAELQRRLDWCAELLASASADVRDSKPGMRNLLVKIGKAVRERFPVKDGEVQWPAAPESATDSHGGPLAGPIAEAWAAVVAEHVAQLPSAPLAYEAWCLQGDPQQPRQLAGQQPLYWLDENFARLFVGSDALGDHSKAGWVLREKADEAGGAHYQVRGALQAHLTCKVVGENPDLTDPKPLLDSICSKTVSVKMAPSQIARNTARVLAALKNPRDPASGALYSPDAVRQRMGVSKTTMADYLDMVGQYEPDTQRPDGSVEAGARHGGMCDEVLDLIDRGAMSMAFAISERDSVFVKWPKKGPREALPYDVQRLILAHLYAELSPGASGEPRFTGELARALGTKLRNAALQGKLGPVGEDADDEGEERSAPQKPTAAQAAQQGAKDEAPARKPGRQAAFDADAFRVRVAQTLQSAPPAEKSSRAYSAADIASLVGAVVLHVRAGAELELRELSDEHRQVLRALLAPLAPLPPVVGEGVLVGDWISAALDAEVANGRDFRPGAVTVETVAANGAKPTAEQAARANGFVESWLKSYTEGGDAVTEKTFEDYVSSRVAELPAA